MEILIDTHILIWIIEEDRQLTEKLKSILFNSEVKKLISQISLMELAIKLSLGKLPGVTATIAEFIDSIAYNNIEIIPLKNAHIEAYQAVPVYDNHRDPFDRFIIATAIHEGFSIMSVDEKFQQYSSIIDIIS